MNTDYYTAVEAKFGFSIPNDYRELEKRGFMFLDKPAHSHDFITPGKGYLWLNDMEWFTPEQISKFDFEEYHFPGFIPFAFTGAGDYWCWQPEFSDENGTRVVLCPHDYEFGSIYAPNFYTALYRQILEYACFGIDDINNLIEVKAFLKRWSIDLSCILPQMWCERILALCDNHIVEWLDHGMECIGLLKPETVKEIEATDIDFSLMDEEFQWMKPYNP